MSNGQARFYPGVRQDARDLAHPTEGGGSVAGGIAFSVTDMLFSAVLDTLLLPVDCVTALTEKHENPPPNTAPEPTK